MQRLGFLEWHMISPKNLNQFFELRLRLFVLAFLFQPRCGRIQQRGVLKPLGKGALCQGRRRDEIAVLREALHRAQYVHVGFKIAGHVNSSIVCRKATGIGWIWEN